MQKKAQKTGLELLEPPQSTLMGFGKTMLKYRTIETKRKTDILQPTWCMISSSGGCL